MEKKTIGKFISALRKANGMTQREFGEKLFVSDKTVSRWECDECTPDLSLIPAIAEIFGITADELLRGERNNPERLEKENGEQKQKEKSEKQFRFMLDRTRKKYQNFTMISVGITILGLISAMIANLSFTKGLIAFCLSLAFCTASEICQICFAGNARFSLDEEEDRRAEQLRLFNNDVTKTAIRISFFNVSARLISFRQFRDATAAFERKTSKRSHPMRRSSIYSGHSVPASIPWSNQRRKPFSCRDERIRNTRSESLCE